jgi:hypothetical protein
LATACRTSSSRQQRVRGVFVNYCK